MTASNGRRTAKLAAALRRAFTGAFTGAFTVTFTGALTAMLLLSVPAGAQSLLPDAGTGPGGNTPIEILADDGIEWLRDARRYIARGNATAIRDGVTVRADTLTAYYREGAGEGERRQTIFRLDADNNVVITSGDSQATGDKAVYHVDRKVAVIVGDNLRLINPRATITAEESLEYWEDRQLAVARGNATVVEGENRLVADILTAYIRPNAEGRSEVERIDAINNVHISTGTEIIRGREGVYDVPNETASICGDVKITRGENQLNGECAVVDMKTGKSRITGAPGGGKVKGLILQTD